MKQETRQRCGEAKDSSPLFQLSQGDQKKLSKILCRVPESFRNSEWVVSWVHVMATQLVVVVVAVVVSPVCHHQVAALLCQLPWAPLAAAVWCTAQ